MEKNTQLPTPKLTPDIIRSSKTVECKHCSGKIFEQKMVLKTISPLLSPNGQALDIPIQVLVCSNCGKVLSLSDPDNLVPADLK
jgi:DNA-directed RNA polymerase subunit RPC12/RpoP